MKKSAYKKYRSYVKQVGKHPLQKLTTVNSTGFLIGKTVKRLKSDYCFGDLSVSWGSNEYAKSDLIFLQVNNSLNSSEVLHTYYEWLLNYSLFRDCFISKNLSRIMKDRVLVLNPEQDAKLVINAMVAARMAWEEQFQTSTRIGIWFDAVNIGTDPSEAFTVASVVAKRNDHYQIQANNNHELIESYDEVMHLNFLDRKLNLEGQTFKKLGGYKTIGSLFKANRSSSFSLYDFIYQHRLGHIPTSMGEMPNKSLPCPYDEYRTEDVPCYE